MKRRLINDHSNGSRCLFLGWLLIYTTADLFSQVRSGCAFMVHVCQDEHQLYNEFFSKPTPKLEWVSLVWTLTPTCLSLFREREKYSLTYNLIQGAGVWSYCPTHWSNTVDYSSAEERERKKKPFWYVSVNFIGTMFSLHISTFSLTQTSCNIVVNGFFRRYSSLARRKT